MQQAVMHIRDARPEDKERVLAFTANTWELGDYIAKVWDSWLADRQGRFPANSSVQRALERAGYTAEFGMWVMEKRV